MNSIGMFVVCVVCVMLSFDLLFRCMLVSIRLILLILIIVSVFVIWLIVVMMVKFDLVRRCLVLNVISGLFLISRRCVIWCFFFLNNIVKGFWCVIERICYVFVL